VFLKKKSGLIYILLKILSKIIYTFLNNWWKNQIKVFSSFLSSCLHIFQVFRFILLEKCLEDTLKESKVKNALHL